jgi:RNA-directed DNA polymerase
VDVRNHPDRPFERYADDGVVHCQTEAEAVRLKAELVERFKECGLELHPIKTRIVYCKDDNRRKGYEHTSFDFLGYTFRPRMTRSKSGKHFVGFTPAVGGSAKKAMRQQVRRWKIHSRTGTTLEALARAIDPIVRGWIQYCG